MQNLDEVGLRNENCLIFWPRCTDKKRLNDFQLMRIREMIATGGLEEACSLFDRLLPPINSATISKEAQGITD